MQYTLVILVVGFPIAMTLSWFFSFTTHGVARESSETEDAIVEDGRNLDFVVIGVLAAALVTALLYIGATRESMPPTTAATSVLAILPLSNISSDTPDSGFIDGLHHDLLGTLSQLSPLQVISRTSVLGFRNTTSSIRDIGSQLGADKIMEGSVQLANNMIRISVTLIDVNTDSQLWARTYEKPFNAKQLFTLQRDIALAVADELKIALNLNEDKRLESLPTASTEAYRLYLLGRLRTAERTGKALAQAVTFFEQAIDLDPKYAEAYAALAYAYNLQHHYSNLVLEDMIDKAMPLVQRALELDANLSDAHVVLADLRSLRDDVQGAENAYQKALSLNPNNALGHHWYGIMLLNQGRYKEALTQHLRAQKLDPLSPIISVNVAQDYSYLGDTEAALAEYKRTLEIKPDFVPVYAHMASLYGRSLRRPDEAVRWLRDAWELDSGHTEYPSQLAEALLDLDDAVHAGQWADVAFELGPTQYWPNRAKLFHALYIGDQEAIERHSKLLLDISPVQFDSLLHTTQRLIDSDYASEAKRLFLPYFAELLEQPPNVNSGNYPWAVLLAHVLQATGEHEQATALLQSSLNVMQSEPRIGFTGVELFDVAALALLGQADLAMARLNEAQASNWSQGWWKFRHQPFFANIRDRSEAVEFDDNFLSEMRALRDSLPEDTGPPSN